VSPSVSITLTSFEGDLRMLAGWSVTTGGTLMALKDASDGAFSPLFSTGWVVEDLVSLSLVLGERCVMLLLDDAVHKDLDALR
jgi:hypothetical protein